MNILDIDFNRNNHTLVFAPNATGKTRLAKKLIKKYNNGDCECLTSGRIQELASFNQTGKSIAIGFEAKYIDENEKIEKEFKKFKISDFLEKYYGIKKATDLTKKSFLFKKINIRKIDSFKIYDGLKCFCLNSDRNFQYDFSLEKLISFDKLFNSDVVDDVKTFCLNAVDKIIFDQETKASEEFISALQIIKKGIAKNANTCPLCGFDYSSKRRLNMAINEKIKSYQISNDGDILFKMRELENLFEKANEIFDENIFRTNDFNYFDVTDLLENLSKALNISQLLAHYIMQNYAEAVDTNSYETYKKNEKMIDSERKKRENNKRFIEKALQNIRGIITLPHGFDFKIEESKIQIIDEKKSAVEPYDFLSDSELRRFCIGVLLAEISERNIKKIVFDDPVDSTDDYYFDSMVNAIYNGLSSHKGTEWIILTHEFRMISIFAKKDADSNSNENKYIFYLPNPLYSGYTRSNPDEYCISPEQINAINEHEVIIFRKIFSNELGYGCDAKLALLSSFNQIRGLYRDLLISQKVRGKALKKLDGEKGKITLVTHRYEHFMSGKEIYMKDLFLMNKYAYEDGVMSVDFETTSKANAIIQRKKMLKRNYLAIYCENPLIKYILLSVLRVLECHYQFEMKLSEWAHVNVPGFVERDFRRKCGIYRKIKYVEDLLASVHLYSLDIIINNFKNVYQNWSNILNDFSHGAAKMFPPYLTISPLEITKLEKDINDLV